MFLADLDKHIVNKCQGFKIQCYACGQLIKTVKGMKTHIKYHCPELQIQCFFCTESFTRESFKDVSVHPCRLQLDQIFQKLRGQPEGLPREVSMKNLESEYLKHISEAAQQPVAEGQGQIVEAHALQPSVIENYVNALKSENEHFKKSTIDSQMLPLASQLLCIKQMNSMINFKLCIDPTCLQKYQIQGSGTKCQETMTLAKQDGAQASRCAKCNQQRHCKMYQCQECLSTFCSYCLVDEQKKVLLGLIDENFDPNDIRDADQPAFGSDSVNGSQIQDLVEPKPRVEEKAEKNSQMEELVRSCFGKYAD